MKRIAALFVGVMLNVSVLYAQAPPPKQSYQAQPGCVVANLQVGSDAIVTRTRPVYLCDAFYGMGSVMRVPVPKPWFKAHCHVYPNLANGLVAWCDAVYEGAGNPAPVSKAAAPSRVREHLKAFGAGAAAVGVLTLCALSGGCGFMGGGL